MNRFFALLIFALFPLAAHATEVKEVATSGLTAWLVEEHSLPIVTVKISFTESGFAHDPAGKEGRANMVAALLMEGAGELNSNAFNQALESRAIQINTAADDDKLELLMQCLSEQCSDAFSYIGMMLEKPRFDDDAITRVRSQSLTILTQQEQNPGYMAYRAAEKMAFPGHGYSNPAVGTRTSIKALDRDDLKNYAKRYIAKNNMLIAVSGDISPEALAALLDKHFAGLPATASPDTSVAEITLPSQGRTQVIDHDIPQTMVRFSLQGLKRTDPDYFTAYVMNHILGGGDLTSRLGVEIREKRGLAYSVATQLSPKTHGATWIGAFSTRNEKASEALSTLRKTLEEFAATGPSEKELADAKRFITNSFVLSLDSNPAIVNFLISMQENKLGRDYFDKRNKLVEAVTREGVAAMAKRLLNTQQLLVVMVGKPSLPEGEH